MHIDFESSGGYANIKLKYHGNTNELPKEVANKLIQLMEDSRIFDLRENEIAPGLSSPPDLLHYKLTIHDGNKRISLSFNDTTIPGSLHPLLTFLQEIAREQVMKGK